MLPTPQLKVYFSISCTSSRVVSVLYEVLPLDINKILKIVVGLEIHRTDRLPDTNNRTFLLHFL